MPTLGTPWLTPKKSRIDFSLHNGIGELRRGLTRYHHVDVGQFVAQDPQTASGIHVNSCPVRKPIEKHGFRMSDSASSSGCCFSPCDSAERACSGETLDLREVSSIPRARRVRSCAAYLVLKVPNLPTSTKVVTCVAFAVLPPSDFRLRQPR